MGAANPVSQLNVFLGRGDGTFAAGPNYGFGYNFNLQIFPATDFWPGILNHRRQTGCAGMGSRYFAGFDELRLIRVSRQRRRYFPVGDHCPLEPWIFYSLQDLNHDGNPDIVELVQPIPRRLPASTEFQTIYGPGRRKLLN